jgi:hypothetical protein
MSPPLDVPSAPPRLSTDSSAMPRPRIAVLSEAVLAPGSPEASLGSGRGSPSVCATSYLGIPQPGLGNAAGSQRAILAWSEGRSVFERDCCVVQHVGKSCEPETSDKRCGVRTKPLARRTLRISLARSTG